MLEPGLGKERHILQATRADNPFQVRLPSDPRGRAGGAGGRVLAAGRPGGGGWGETDIRDCKHGDMDDFPES